MTYTEKIKQLSLKQKCALLSGADVFRTRAVKSLGIPAIWLSDGPHGLRKQVGPADHLGLNPSEPATCFPTMATVSCSWDIELGERIGEALGQEAAAKEVHVVLGPGLNMKRNPLCGRNFEYVSEDPYLAGKMAAAYIRGIQKNGIAACPKHFAVNNQETRRMASDSIVDERAFREIYLTGFEIAVKEGMPKTIMTSYNLINGTYANENKHLLTDILKNDWGFRGAVITDWGGSNDHVAGVRAGSTLEMPAPGLDSARELLAAIQNGELKEAEVDERVEELLELVFDTDEAVKKSSRKIPEMEHHRLAMEAARSSLTLLKNEEKLLPLQAGTKVTLIGDFAEDPRYQGAGSSVVNVTKLDCLLDCIKETTLELVGFAKGFDRLGKQNAKLKQEALILAERADAVILCIGLNEIQESEGLDRTDMKIQQNQIDLLCELKKKNPNIIVVLMAGSVVETTWRSECKSILYACLGGQAGAQAVSDAITGKMNPCGKLAETWPERYEDVPSKGHFAGDGRMTEYRESIFIGYRYYQKADIPVAFPFGFGMSYTQFSYGNLEADAKKATFTVKNTGSYDGTEIVQLYVEMPGKSVFSPTRELKGFTRVELRAGEEKKVTILLDDKAFRYWNVKSKRWETEGGTYQIHIGASSEDIRLSAQITVAGTNAPKPYDLEKIPSYQTGRVQKVDDSEFEIVLGRSIPKEKREITVNTTIGEINHGKSPVGWIVWRILKLLLEKSKKEGRPDLNLLFVYNMPLRALAKMTNGMVSMGMVEGIVLELKGGLFVGIAKVIKEFFKNRKANKKMEEEL